MKKIICISFVLFLIVATFCSCYLPSDHDKRPDSQPNTKWVSEDGTVELYVHDNGKITGTMVVSGKPVEIYWICGIKANAEIYPIEEYEDDDNVINGDSMLEKMVCSYKTKDKFVATVYEATNFEVGQEIVFYKVG